MINHLKGRATFTTSGATIVVDFQPKPGITAVVGPNGSGKTFTAIESLRYLLFGAAALRGQNGDFSELEMAGNVTIRGLDYDIKRTLKSATISRGTELIATGATAVTKAVVDALGYNLDVFDVCNAALQKRTASLGAMRASERKAMFDQILGVLDVKAAEKDCRDEATGLNREVDALVKALPVLGERPIGTHTNTTTLRQRLADGRGLRDKHDALRAQLQPTVAPERPHTRSIDGLAELEAHEAERAREVAEIAHRQRVLANRPELSLEQIELAEKRFAYDEEVRRRGTRPTMPIGDVMAMMDTWERRAVLLSITDQETTCPKCSHVFRTREELPPEPAVSRAELGRQLEEHRNWAKPLPPEPVSDWSLSPRDAGELRQRHKLCAEFDAQPLVERENRSEELSQLREDIAALEAYDKALRAHLEVAERNNAVQAKLDALEPAPTTAWLDALSDELREAEAFEAAVARWEQDEKNLVEATRAIDNKRKMSESFKKGAEGLADARATLKAYLAPTLSRVASEHLRDMTNGKLREMVVDEDMEITVDRQRIETLSGAGETVANIALRVALGRILVGKAFPVFIGDEMDGDFDAERREATIQAMLSLKQHLSQIILITHRDVSIADHVHSLGDGE